MRILASLAVVVLLAGCSRDQNSESCREGGQEYPRKAVSVGEAEARTGELVRVKGGLIARNGRPVEICEELSPAKPPSCEGPSLRIEGLRDTSAFERGESAGDTTWWNGATTAGRIDGETVRYELDCRARAVRRQLGEAIGEEPGFNAFASNADGETLDYGPLPHLVPARIRETYGAFGVTVRGERDPALRFSDLTEEPDDRGIGWYRGSRGWFAVKHYDGDILLFWSAGKSKRIDERWARIDAIVARLKPSS